MSLDTVVRPRPVVLVILDGWGVAQPSRGNAITMAQTPVFHKLITTYPTFTLQAGGEAVGLPWGERGNSEVGHLTIGAGKILYQDLPRITRAIVDGSFFQNPVFVKACASVREQNTKLHLIGLVSPGGIHSSSEHLYALLELAKQQNISQVFIHAILDGRDTAFNVAKGFLQELEARCKKLQTGTVASIMGRYYAMDRDNHWDRIQAAYNCIVQGQGKPAASVAEAIDSSYNAKVFDEEVVPTTIQSAAGPLTTVTPGDAVMLFNFRADRARQLTSAFVAPDFAGFPRTQIVPLTFVTMTQYDKRLPTEVAYPPETVEYPLARVVADAGLTQLHLAETEKYAHVTYFMNGGHEQPYPKENHVLIPSPVVPSYDQKPRMSARGITDRLLQEIRAGSYDLYIVNYANADMVGHTGNLPATVTAVETLDECLGEVVAATLEAGGMLFITADHGNAESKINLQSGVIDKEHTANPVPFIIVGRDMEHKAASGTLTTDDLSQLTPAGLLADVAPTILKVLNLSKPAEMTGQSLL